MSRKNNPKHPESEDQHHIFYQRKSYKGKLKILRDLWYCKVFIPKEPLHKALHAYVPDIPTPSLIALEGALYQLLMLENHSAIDESDTLEERLLVLAALFDSIAQPTADALREQYRIACEFRDTPSK